MRTYYLREVYFATGEGVSTFIIAGQAETEAEFLELCQKNHSIDLYFISQPHILVEIEKISNDELDMLKNEHPSLYKRIVNKCYTHGHFWWVFREHFNMS